MKLNRKIEKYHRLAYELAHDATVLRKAGHLWIADAVGKMADRLGDLAREVDRR